MENTVWMVHRNKTGVTKYDLASSTIGGTEVFSQTIADRTVDQTVGDGIILYDGILYVSIWEIAPPFNTGTIFQCDLSSDDDCIELAAKVAADLQLDAKSDPDQSRLILPNLIQRKVETLTLGADAQPVDAAETDGAKMTPDEDPDATSTLRTLLSRVIPAAITVNLFAWM